MRMLGVCGARAILSDYTPDHPDTWARLIRRQVAQEHGAGGEGRVWCLVWDEYPVETWGGRRNLDGPDHMLAIAVAPGMSSMQAVREQEVLIALERESYSKARKRRTLRRRREKGIPFAEI
ncbi:hypothetical protein [Streptosporangium roseum]|uniref:hypothetical protein n=1 Tax=Streptosporangium roseum TaxID=2001 RepID=UPI00331C1EDE